jgi:hypothetical protein
MVTEYCTDLFEYFLFSVQIHPVVSRLCASIQGTSPERLADCLGLDTSKVKLFGLSQHSVIYFNYFFISTVLLYWCLQFQHKSSEALSDDPTSSLLFAGDDEERYILFLKYQLIVTMLILRWDSFLFVKTYRYCLAFVCRHTSYCNYKLCFQIFELLYLFMFSRFLLNKGFSSHKYN